MHACKSQVSSISTLMMTTTMPAKRSPRPRGCSGEASAVDYRPEREEGKKRIVDYLHGDDEIDESSRKSCDLCPSPSALSSASSPPSPHCKSVADAAAAASLSCSFRSILIEKPCGLRSAWFPWRRRHGKKKKKTKKRDMTKGSSSQKDRGSRKMTPLDSETVEEGNKEVGSLPPRCSTSGGKPAEAYFSMGMGLGMAYVLARWATEFDKMAELRVQMEKLLEEIRQQVATKCISPNILGLDKNFVSSSSDWCREISTGSSLVPQNQQMLQRVEGDNLDVESNRYSNYEANSRNKGCTRMDELEAELVLELEQLQLNLEYSSLVHPEQERLEMTSGSSKSCQSLHGDSEPKEEEYNEHYEVSARELERRLHQLLHTRHQEQIAELEAALQMALVEKEIEVSRWREAAINASNGVDTSGEDLQKSEARWRACKVEESLMDKKQKWIL